MRLTAFLICVISAALFLGGCSFSRGTIPPSAESLDRSALVSRTTLMSEVAIGYRFGQDEGSVNGLITSDGKDRLRFIVLTPYGSPYLEVLKVREQMTIWYPTKGQGYQGVVTQGGPVASMLALVEWSLAQDLAPCPDGEARLFIEGNLRQKSLPSGASVRYDQFSVVSHVHLAHELLLQLPDGSRIRMQMLEPSVNQALPDDAFVLSAPAQALLPLKNLERIL